MTQRTEMKNSTKQSLIINNIIIFSIILLLSLFIGIREIYIGTDTLAYYNFFTKVNTGIETRISEPLFLLLSKTSYYFSTNFYFFSTLIAFISCSFYFIFYYLILDKNTYSINLIYYIIFISFIFMLISPFFWNSQVNVMRVGVAIPIFFVGSYFLYSRKPLKALFFFISSAFFHYSIFMFIPFVYLIYIKEKYIILVFFFLSMIYLSGVGEKIFNTIADNLSSFQTLKYYLANATNERGYKNGIRFDFYIFTLFFFFISLWIRNYSKSANHIFKLFTVLSFPFLIIGFINFSDRIILLSWSLIPIILALSTARLIKPNNLFYVLTIPILLLITISTLWNKNLL